jgi:conjugative transfer signal peptidase TraF
MPTAFLERTPKAGPPPRLVKRPLALVFAASAAAAAAAVTPASPVLLLNRTPSEPTGVYLRVGATPARGDIIAFRTPRAAFPYADARMAYLHHRPLLKAVAAGPGDAVCTTSGTLVINGVGRAPIAVRDGRGRALPRWRGCRRLMAGEVFVFSARVPNSFDSRYYGPVAVSAILGVYRLLAPISEPA